ncbi:MAG: chromo domain-containing protein, partial [Candidatus Thiodiazotropha sp.]
LKDYAGELVMGTFYEHQLKKAYEQTTYLVEKVLQTRTRRGQKQLLVRWRGWPAKYDSWVGEEDVSALNRSASQRAVS